MGQERRRVDRLGNARGRLHDRHPGEWSRLVVLPASYVAKNVELAYASTAHRAQGRTVDTAHAFASPTTTREVLYVSLTRGSESNHLYGTPTTTLILLPATMAERDFERPRSARRRTSSRGADVSATDMIRLFQTQSIAALVAEYDTIVAMADGDRWETVLSESDSATANSSKLSPPPRTQRCSRSYETRKTGLRHLHRTPNAGRGSFVR